MMPTSGCLLLRHCSRTAGRRRRQAVRRLGVHRCAHRRDRPLRLRPALPATTRHQAPLTSGTSRNTQPKLTQPVKSLRGKLTYALNGILTRDSRDVAMLLQRLSTL